MNESKTSIIKNKEKGIYAIAYINPITNKKTTKSLGKIADNTDAQIEQIKEDVNSILSEYSEYSHYNYNNFYSKLKELTEESQRKAFEIVFKDSKYWKKEINTIVTEIDESFIPIYNKEKNGFCCENSYCLVGLPGAGKSQLLQHILGSYEFNTPACTSSNTTTGQFYSKINHENYLKLSCIMISDLLERISENLNELIKYCIENYCKNKDNNIIDNNIAFNKLLHSNDLKCNLEILIYENESIKERIKEIISDIIDEITPILEKIKENVKEYNILDLCSDFIDIIDGKSESKSRISQKEIVMIKEFDKNKYIKRIYTCIIDAETSIIKQLYKNLKNDSEALNANLIFKCLTTESINEDKIAKNITGLNEITSSKISNLVSIEIQLEYNDKIIDDNLRTAFFKAMSKISSGNTKNNLRPLVKSLKIAGNFKSKIKIINDILNDILDKKSEIIISDNEGIGHNAGKISYSSEFSQNIHYSKKIIWIMDINNGINPSHKDMLKILTSNGSLYKTEIIFSKCDRFKEDTDGDPKKRSYELVENLYKEFNNNEDIINSKNIVLKKPVFIGYLNKNIDGEKVEVKYGKQTIKFDLDEEYKKGLESIFQTNEYKNNSIELEYDLVTLSNVVNKVVEDFLYNYKKDISNEHWSIIKALTCRIAYYDYRKYRKYKPEDDLKAQLKLGIQKVICNPIKVNNSSVNNENKTLYYNDFQVIQEQIGKYIDKIITKILYSDIADKWEKCYKISGEGSGNNRKTEVKNLLENSLKNSNGNIVLNKLFEDLKDLKKDLKDLPYRIKFSICGKIILDSVEPAKNNQV